MWAHKYLRKSYLTLSILACSSFSCKASAQTAAPIADQVDDLVAASSSLDRQVWWSASEALGVLATREPALRDAIWNRASVNTLGMKFVRVGSGTFTMGPDAHRLFDIQKAHEVKIGHACYMGLTEVTNEQLSAILPPHHPDSGFSPEPDSPAVNVTWEQAVEFCKRLSELEGAKYRLPTEAEWEYACRAGTSTPYSFGTDPKLMMDYGRCLADHFAAAPVASLRPNPWGIYDMHGNVFEWVSDWFSRDYYSDCEKKGMVEDPTGPESGGSHVLRSCGWQVDNARACTCAARFPLPTLDKKPFAPGPGMRETIGFRVVREIATRSDR